MGKNNYLLRAFLLIYLPLCFTACKTDNLEKPLPSTFDQPVVEDGRLKFTTGDAFNAFVKQAKATASAGAIPLVKVNRFTSHLTAYTHQQEEMSGKPQARISSEDSLRLTPIPDDFFASLLNANKELEIENDVIYRAGNDYCFVYNKADSSQIEKF